MAEKILSYTEVSYDFGISDPGNPKPGEIFVFYETKDGVKFPSMVEFLCPCGCGYPCPTHLIPPGQEKKPNDRHWEFSRGPSGGVTLSPSIRWNGHCRAHFNITDGKTFFHGDSGK